MHKAQLTVTFTVIDQTTALVLNALLLAATNRQLSPSEQIDLLRKLGGSAVLESTIVRRDVRSLCAMARWLTREITILVRWAGRMSTVE